MAVGRRKEGFSKYLGTSGAGAGTTNAIGDYSVTPAEFYFANATDHPRDAHVARLVISIRDTGAFDPSKYGADGVLPNGISVVHKNSAGAVEEDYTPSDIVSNAGWASLAGDPALDTWGVGDSTLFITVPFSVVLGDPDGLILNPGERLAVILNDDFTFLTEHRFVVQGHYGEHYSHPAFWTYPG